MFVLDRFCESRLIDNYLTILERITLGMSVGDYADLIRMAFEDYYRSNPESCGISKGDVLDILDIQLGGLAGEDFVKLVRHAIGRIADVKKLESAAAKLTEAQKEEKKSKSKKGSSGKTSGVAQPNAG